MSEEQAPPAANHTHILTSLKAGVQAIVLAGNKGYRAEVRSAINDQIIAQATHSVEEQAVDLAIRSAAEQMGVGLGPETPAMMMEKRFAKIEARIGAMEEGSEENGGVIVSQEQRMVEITGILDTLSLRVKELEKCVAGDYSPFESPAPVPPPSTPIPKAEKPVKKN